MSQPLLIRHILDMLGLNKRTKGKSTPAIESKILHWMRTNGNKMGVCQHVRTNELPGKIHQAWTGKCCTPMCKILSQLQGKPQMAVWHIGRIKGEGIIIQPNDQDMELWYNADLCGNLKIETAHEDRTTAKSRTWYTVKYVRCPVIWASKMQKEMALSTTEVELIAMSEGLRPAIP